MNTKLSKFANGIGSQRRCSVLEDLLADMESNYLGWCACDEWLWKSADGREAEGTGVYALF
jgi:hypothetical protein